MFQLVMPVGRSPRSARVPLFRCQHFAPLAFDDLLELASRVGWLGGEWGGGHGEPQDFGDHVGPEPAHQRGAARGVVGLLVIEEKPVNLCRGESE